MTDQDYVNELVKKGKAAQEEFEKFSQEEVDAVVRACARAIFEHAEELAEMDVKESEMGKLEDKIIKSKSGAEKFWWHLKGKKSRGILKRLDDIGIIEIAKPLGVVGSITPVTSGVATTLHNTMCALKGGNAIIISPHPRAKKTVGVAVDLMNEYISKFNAPENLIQVIAEPTAALSQIVMASTDVCISTGGPGLVKSAYKSGKPAFGVGQGNVQCLVDRGMDLDDVAEKVIKAREFENGLPCSCEQFVHIPEEELDDFTAKLVEHGAYYIDDAEKIDRIRQLVFPEGALNKDMVGKYPVEIAKQAGIEIPEETRALYLKVTEYAENEVLAKEKLFPVASVRTYDTWEEAVDVARKNLLMEGAGHSTTIHSNDQIKIEYAAELIPVSRFAINQPATQSVGGTLTNGVAPTGTLGCGSWGNNSISENLDYVHMYNTARVIYEPKGVKAPTSEEIWS